MGMIWIFSFPSSPVFVEGLKPGSVILLVTFKLILNRSSSMSLLLQISMSPILPFEQ